LLTLPGRLDHRIQNYVASVATDRRGETAAITAPRGGLAVIIEVATGRCLAHHEMPSVSGVAETRDGFLLTAENGGMSAVGGEPSSRIENRPHHLVAAWDNHVIALD
jgi:hypothetical protein